MQLEGKETFSVSPDKIWELLMDTDSLAKITPGLSKIEETGNGQYNAIADVKIGPVKGQFQGDLSMEDINENESFLLRIEQKSKIGNVKADVRIVLTPISENETELSFVGDAKMSGLLARTGSRVISGVANSLTKQFFEGLTNELETPK